MLGVTGGIAAYKAAELVRALRKGDAEVRVIMTASALEFVQPLTFETLSDHPVYTTLFPERREPGVIHISLSEWADLLLIAPATANIIGKVASGIADDLLSTVATSVRAPIVFAPAMEESMLSNPIVSGNIEKLRDLGYGFVEPERGFLASGKIGRGRLASLDAILKGVIGRIAPSLDLTGRRVLVTAGRTEEDLDPVRFLTNRSSGKMGYALAERAQLRGAQVSLVSGPTNLSPPKGVRRQLVRTGQEMEQMVNAAFPRTDVVVMAAAVADFRPQKREDHKIKKGYEATLVLELERTRDILADLGGRKGDRILVGFAVETEDEIEHAKVKLQNKNLDCIVLNNPKVEGAGFGTDTNVVTLIDKHGKIEPLPKLSKLEVADRVLDKVVQLLTEKEGISEE